jgi:hypothetical protein
MRSVPRSTPSSRARCDRVGALDEPRPRAPRVLILEGIEAGSQARVHRDRRIEEEPNVRNTECPRVPFGLARFGQGPALGCTGDHRLGVDADPHFVDADSVTYCKRFARRRPFPEDVPTRAKETVQRFPRCAGLVVPHWSKDVALARGLRFARQGHRPRRT